MSLTLTADEQTQAEQLQALLITITQDVQDPAKRAGLREKHDQLGQLGRALHQSLAKRGSEPRHKRQMIENRGVQPDHPDFYKHSASAEDLLAFIADPVSAGDPPDLTIGSKFNFRVFSRRQRHEDTYSIERTAKGWHVSHITISGECDKRGMPHLFDNFHQDSIQYPRGVGEYLERIWDEAQNQGLPAEAVQAELDRLADWVSKTEKSAPQGGVFSSM